VTSTELRNLSSETLRPSSPYAVALLWGNAGLLGGASVTALAALPFRPTSGGWDELGWLLVTLAACAAVGALAAAGALWTGLRRCGASRPALTAVAYLPVAVLLAAVTAGVGVLAAPAAAVWLVDGLRRPAQPGYGPGGRLADRRHGLPQRLVLTLVGCALVTAWVLGDIGHRWGGLVHGEVVVWAACLPALVGLPALLLGGRVRWRWIGALVVALCVVAAFAVPGAVADSRPTADRLLREVEALPVPDGAAVTATAQASASWGSFDSAELPVISVVAEPAGAEPGMPVPAALSPDPTGRLPGRHFQQGVVVVDARPATASGERLAREWEERLMADGWKVDEYSLTSTQSPSETYWLPEPARALVDARPHRRLTDGPWRRAVAVPYGDAALLVVSLRP
jgi:hypothetical protein